METVEKLKAKGLKSPARYIIMTQRTASSTATPLVFAQISCSGGNPVKYTDPDGNSKWIKVYGTDWWFRTDPSAAGDPAHYHFVKGDPYKSHAQFYNRRVYPQLKGPNDTSTPQKGHGEGGRGGIDKNVPEVIIQKAVQQKNSGENFQSVTLSEPFFGLLGVENLAPEAVTVHNFDENYPLWGNGDTLTLNYAITRNKESGELNFTLYSAISERTGLPFVGGINVPPLTSLAPGIIPSYVPSPVLVPELLY